MTRVEEWTTLLYIERDRIQRPVTAVEACISELEWDVRSRMTQVEFRAKKALEAFEMARKNNDEDL